MEEGQINIITDKIIGAAIEVHRNLGPGMLESAYQAALAHELRLRGMRAATEVEIPFVYKGVKLDVGYRADMVVEDEVIVELKATENESPLYCRQLLTYLKIYGKKIGLLINFNRSTLVKGVTRLINSPNKTKL